MRGEKGFALVLTLVVTALMVALAAELIHQVYVDTSISRGFRDGQQASLLAESGVDGGTKLFQFALANQDYTSLSDMWAKPFPWNDEVGSVELNVVEENGKIDLNGLIRPNKTDIDDFTMNALKRLGKRLQIPEDCWSALADWQSSGDSARPGGAKTPYYKTLKPPYSARNDKLATLAELSLVKGFTPEIIAKLRPFVTIYPIQTTMQSALVNINTAPKEVLMALDDRVDDTMAGRIMDERKVQPFKSPGELSRVDAQLASALAARITCKGSFYRVTSVGRVNDAARTVEAVVWMSGGTPGILSWQEY